MTVIGISRHVVQTFTILKLTASQMELESLQARIIFGLRVNQLKTDRSCLLTKRQVQSADSQPVLFSNRYKFQKSCACKGNKMQSSSSPTRFVLFYLKLKHSLGLCITIISTLNEEVKNKIK